MTRPLIQCRKATPVDFEGILRLQQQNLLSTLRGEDLSQGFLTIELTREQLHKINSELGIFVAIQGEKVIGYLMAESLEFAVGSPLIAHLLNRLKEIVFNDVPLSSRRMFVYGPVCIDREHRGRRVLEELFKVMLQAVREHYDVGVAFVSVLNPRSFHAHTNKIGMVMIDEFEFNGQKYWTLVFEVEAKKR
jgi:predicted N-acetyltransferase YhbS